MNEALRQAAENAADVLDEARTYVGCESWSPSMLEECERALRMLRAALAQPPAQPDRLYDALCWALGVGDDWKPRPDGAGPFYWRKELAERAGICWDGSRYVMAAQPVQQPTARTFADWVNSLTTEETHQFDAAGRGYKKDAHQMMRLAWGAAQAAPAQRQPLSDEEIEAIWKAHVLPGFGERQRFYSPVVYARAIESAHGIAAQKGEKL